MNKRDFYLLKIGDRVEIPDGRKATIVSLYHEASGPFASIRADGDTKRISFSLSYERVVRKVE